MSTISFLLEAFSAYPLLTIGIGGSLSILASSFALGLRHGIDWDHIAAIVDITSTSAVVGQDSEKWLIKEPGLMLTDESHHALATAAVGVEESQRAGGIESPRAAAVGTGVLTMTLAPPRWVTIRDEQRRPLFLGTAYAAGHGTMVVALGLLAILAAELLPAWVDPIMERVVGVTLLILAAYLFYSLYRFFRGDGDFRLRSRWMLVFAAIRTIYRRAVRGIHGHEHRHVEPGEQYGGRTAYAIGLIHGIGAETGTQLLLIATVVGAGTKVMGVAALLSFVLGLLVSNSIVTYTTTAGFISARRRRGLYVSVGLLAAVFSLVLGVVFLLEAGRILPNLDPLARWIGGPSV